MKKGDWGEIFDLQETDPKCAKRIVSLLCGPKFIVAMKKQESDAQ